MHSKLFMLLTLSAFSVELLAANMYKCTDENGRPVFSQTVCGDDVVRIELRNSGVTETVYDEGRFQPEETGDKPEIPASE